MFSNQYNSEGQLQPNKKCKVKICKKSTEMLLSN